MVDTSVQTYPKGNSLKINLITRLEAVLAENDVADWQVNYNIK